ncbi:catechol 2,3-dioxygenase-like lactoylglutathione lyase family enzyme [Chitinivorax tropicus]|uniref:Catechol 2,3-dioxygenase-like lactoylglutathione lyase family enzyme n=1 Tax=Chitinivorax tropicus TaxID=714531 RepID=A0A840MFM8_9PROT|nr:VOC family protein [Chitinivorax tropicus]MBB5017468.1 catechol 2,3-dioxygenase-like lactoylglutathione lyase family enzyme [Chitinivorax tropicus]
MQFAYTIVYVESVETTLAFYEAALGCQRRFLHESGLYGELETGATTLAFAAHEVARENLGVPYQAVRPDGPPPGIELAFATPDVPQAYHRAVAAGAAPIQPPAIKPWGQTVAYVRAPDGTLIELCTPMH